MEIHDLRVEKYNKIANLSQLQRPELLSNLCIYDKRDYFRNVHCFDVADNNSHRFQLYVSKVPPRNILEDIVFVKESPKILFLRGESENVVIEENISDRLSDYLVFHDAKQAPYLHESEARNMIMNIVESTQDFLKHKLIYDCFSPKNVVRIDEKWYLSTVGLLFNVDCNLPEYSSIQITEQQKRTVYSWACLLFKLVFGFVPFQSSKKAKQFDFKNYLAYLEGCSQQSLLKIYYYSFRVLEVSPACLDLLTLSLSGKLGISEWKNHNYFTQPFQYESSLNEKNRQLKMVNAVSPSNYSLVMAAIQHKKKMPMEKLNPKLRAGPQQPSYLEVIELYRKNNLLKYFVFAPDFEKKQTVAAGDSSLMAPTQIGDYFYQNSFDVQEDFPCRQLIKLIEKQKEGHPEMNSDDRRQAQIKLYAYPYAMAFELCKVEAQQSIQVRRKIKKTIDLLLELSTLYETNKIKPLHHTQTKYKEFAEMKAVYRQHVNGLYQYFLNEAMRKYNSKKDTTSIIERMKRKEKGLDYYRLSLKLLEASLIVRKGGKNLDLCRIETNERKQIERDIEELLKSYFPNRAEIH